MWLIEASKPPVDGPVGMNLQRTPLDSGEMSQITVTRRRIKVRRLKYTCRTKKTSSSSEEEDVGDSVKVSLSVSSSEKDEVVLSYGSVSVIWRRREMEDAVRAELGIMNKKGGGVGVGGKYDFFGVYDGHGGCHVARACSERLHGILVEEGESSNEELEGLSEYWERVMEGCFGLSCLVVVWLWPCLVIIRMDLSLYYLFIERRSLELLYVYHSRIAYYYLYSLLNIVLLYVTTKVVLGTPWVVALLIYKWRRRHFINK
nr:putative protein phosphatase 2c 51 [Quercus suber]